jgi:hypothetical protein
MLHGTGLARSLPTSLPARCPRSPLDPAGLLHRAFVQEPGERATPEDTLVAWLMSLAPGADPAAAARRIVDTRLEIGVEVDDDAGMRRLMSLLEETARWPQERLVRARLGRKRKAGRRGTRRHALRQGLDH